MRYIISIIVIFVLSGTCAAQPTDTTEVSEKVKDIIQPKDPDRWKPSGVRLGIDVVPAVQSFINDEFNSAYLIVADIDFHRYFFVAEYGTLDRNRIGTAGEYNVNGSYWRAGIDANLFKNDPDNSVLSIGLRYGRSRFSDQLQTTIFDEFYGPQDLIFSNSNLSGDWFELVAGLKVKIWKFWLGYNFRLKLGIDDYLDQDFVPYEVPGYGLAGESDYWEANYYLMYRIEWREKKKPLPELD